MLEKLKNKEEGSSHRGPFNKQKIQQLQNAIMSDNDAEKEFEDWSLERLREQSEFAMVMNGRRKSQEQQQKDMKYEPMFPPIAKGVIQSQKDQMPSDGKLQQDKQKAKKHQQIEPKLMAQRQALKRGDIALFQAIEKLNLAGAKQLAMRLQVTDQNIPQQADEIFKCESDLDDQDISDLWENLNETQKVKKNEQPIDAIVQPRVEQEEVKEQNNNTFQTSILPAQTIKVDTSKNYALQFERKQYRKHLQTLRKAHAEQIKNVKLVAKTRIQDILKRKIQSIKHLFLDQVHKMLSQFQQLKSENNQQKKQITALKEVIQLQQRQLVEFRTALQQNAIKQKQENKLKSKLTANYVFGRAVEDYQTRLDRNPFMATEKFLNDPFHFYDSYLVLSQSQKKEIMQSELIKYYKEKMMKMQDQVEQLQSQLKTNATIFMLHDEHQTNADRAVKIFKQQKQQAERVRDREIERMQNKMDDQMQDFITEKKQMNQRFEVYKQISFREIQLNQQIRKRQENEVNQLKEELLELRNIIRQPRLHYKLMQTLGYEELLQAYADRQQQQQLKTTTKSKKASTNVVNISFDDHKSGSNSRNKTSRNSKALSVSSIKKKYAKSSKYQQQQDYEQQQQQQQKQQQKLVFPYQSNDQQGKNPLLQQMMQNRNYMQLATNVSHAPSLSAMSDMPATKRAAVYALRQSKKMGADSPSMSSMISHSTALGTNKNSISRTDIRSNVFDSHFSFNRGGGGGGGGVFANDDQISLSQASGVVPAPSYLRNSKHLRGSGGAQSYRKNNKYSSLNLKQRFQQHYQKVGENSNNSIDLQSFSVNEFVDRSKMSRMDGSSSLSESVQLGVGGGGTNKRRPGGQSVETENFVVGYEEIAERLDQANTTQGDDGFRK